MSNSDRHAFDFVENVERLTSAGSVVDAMAAAFARFGFETTVLLRLPNASERFEQVVLATRGFPEWFSLYAEKDYIRFDPTLRQAKDSSLPFTWADTRYDSEKERAAAEVMARAADFGMSRGLVVPLHDPSGYKAAVSLGGKRLDLTVRHKAAIHMMALYGFERVCQLLTPRQKPRRLSKRERDVLAWSAQGKSAWEIGEILNIKQRTVEEHATRACHKLGAVNRTHAVAIAIRERLIEP